MQTQFILTKSVHRDLNSYIWKTRIRRIAPFCALFLQPSAETSPMDGCESHAGITSVYQRHWPLSGLRFTICFVALYLMIGVACAASLDTVSSLDPFQDGLLGSSTVRPLAACKRLSFELLSYWSCILLVNPTDLAGD
jgi:hypothetical protein